jgi:hypothetical protein
LLGNPDLRPLTVEDRCAELGISRSTWYRHMEDPLFEAKCHDAWRQMIANDRGLIYDALLRSATIEGREGFQDRKLALELYGDYQPGLRVDTGPGGAGEKKVGKDLTDAELVAMCEGREHLLPPGVRRRLGIDPRQATDPPFVLQIHKPSTGALHVQVQQQAKARGKAAA